MAGLRQNEWGFVGGRGGGFGAWLGVVAGRGSKVVAGGCGVTLVGVDVSRYSVGEL